MTSFISIRYAAAMLIAIIAATISSFANAPANDTFANAIDLGSSRTAHVLATNAEATKEPGEPDHGFNAGGSSIWYKWTATSRGLKQFSLARSNFNTLLAIYTGTSVDNLQLVISSNDIVFTSRSALRFNPEPGQTYYIAIDGVRVASLPAETGLVRLDIAPSITRSSADYDRDGITDLAVFRPSDGTWYIKHSTADNPDFYSSAIRWGMNGDIPVPGTYTNPELHSEPSVFRPSTGTHYLLQTTVGGFPMRALQFGQAGDIPVQGNFSQYATADINVFRPSNGTWYFMDSDSPDITAQVQFGQTGDIPVPGDYTDDQMTDIAVFRPSNGVWYILPVKPSPVVDELSEFDQPRSIQFGQAGDKPVPGDYDGDGIIDPAIFRPSTGFFWVLRSTDGVQQACPWGLSTDIPTPGDFDGDGMSDFAVFRPSNGVWYILQSSDNQMRAEHWGKDGDIPVTSNIR